MLSASPSERDAQPTGVFLGRPTPQASQFAGFLEADFAFQCRSRDVGCKKFADTRIPVVVEIATAGRCLAAPEVLTNAGLAEFKEGAALNEFEVHGLAGGNHRAHLEWAGKIHEGVFFSA